MCRTLGSAAGGTSIAAHGDSLLLLLHILEESDGTLELPAIDSLGGLAGVLERGAEVGTAGAGRLCGFDLSRSVSDLKFARTTCQSVFFVPPADNCPIVLQRGGEDSRGSHDASRATT